MSDAEEEPPLKMKLSVIGDGTCGKTTLVNQFVHGSSSKEYEQTVGVDFYLKHVYLQALKKSITVQIWDIGGQNLGGSMLDKYLCGSQGILIVYDIMNLSSFENLEDWVEAVRNLQSSTAKRPHLALVANKCDMDQQSVKKELHNRFARSNNLSSHFVSAKTGESVVLCFHQIIADVLDIHLGRGDTHEEQTIVKAEIIRHRENTPSQNIEKSAVCTLQ